MSKLPCENVVWVKYIEFIDVRVKKWAALSQQYNRLDGCQVLLAIWCLTLRLLVRNRQWSQSNFSARICTVPRKCNP